MKTVKNAARFVALLAVLCTGGAVCAQPSIPKQQIPSGLPTEVRQRLEALYASDPRQRARAAAELGADPELADPAIPFLIAMLHDDAVLYDKAELQRRDFIASFIGLFGIANSPGQQAAEALAGIGARQDKPDAGPLIGCLANENAAVRANAVRALGEMLRAMDPDRRMEITADGRIADSLIKAIEDRHRSVRKGAAIVLRLLADPRAVAPLIVLLQKDPSWEVREAAAAALGAIGDPRAVESLIAALQDPQERGEVRQSAALALGTTKDLRAVGPLTRALDDPDWRIRIAALTVADVVRDFRVLRPLLIDALQDEEWPVRAAAASAASALAKLKDPDVLQLLTTALRDGQPNVRARATESLAQLDDARAIAPLIVILREDPNAYVRWHAAMALERIEDPRTVGPLTAALEDQDELVRTTARRALEKIKKAEPSRRI